MQTLKKIKNEQAVCGGGVSFFWVFCKTFEIRNKNAKKRFFSLL